MTEPLDPLDRQHYQSLDTFRVLLETLGYDAEYDETEGLTVRVDPDEHPLVGFELATIAQEGVAHGLFGSQISGSDGPDAPLEVILGIPNADKPLPLWRRVESPEDYFILVDEMRRVVLKFDFDSPEGIIFTSSLMDHSEVYIDYEKEEGCQRALVEHLREVFPEDLEKFLHAFEDDDDVTLKQFWLDHFDYAFESARGEPDAHLIVHCIGPIDKYQGDYMFFLMDHDSFEELRIPPSYVVTLTEFRQN